MQNQDNLKPARRFRARWKLLGLALLLGSSAWWFSRRDSAQQVGSTFVVRRGNLPIRILEGGSLEALESLEIRSEVKGSEGRKILSIVEEGQQVTEEDVKNAKILVELDSSEIKQRMTTQEIEYQTRQSALIEAQQAYEIQLNQNRSDIKAAEQKAKFSRLDMEKFLGDKVAEDILNQLGIKESSFDASAASALALLSSTEMKPGAMTTNAPVSATNGATHATSMANGGSPLKLLTNGVAVAGNGPLPGLAAIPDLPQTLDFTTQTPSIDFSKYAKVELLGDGEAQQKLREAKDSLLLAEKEKSSNQAKLTGTERLFQKEFVTKVELDTARLEFEQVDLKVKKSATALNLFMKYEFPKQAEELLSKYEEALRNLDRTRKEAISKSAQGLARLKSAQSQFIIVQENRQELERQVTKCTIRATKPGLVTYGGSREGYYYGEERIREGATIRERQPIITIPNLSKMTVKVKVHESHVKKVKKGMNALIRVDSFPDKRLTGEIIKVGVLPDSENRWMNPDMKVYATTIRIEGEHDWLKPGMSAKVEILVAELKDVLYVPMQAVTPLDQGHVCYVVNHSKSDSRRVETGEYNDEFIEIKSGLKPGETLLLRSSEGAKQKADKKAGEEKSDSLRTPEKAQSGSGPPKTRPPA